MELKIGDRVVKKSGKPFKASNANTEALKHDFIVGFEVNEVDPQRRVAAKLQISETLVNVYQLKKDEE